MNTILLSAFFLTISLIKPICSANDNGISSNKNNSVNDPTGLRFQRILHRKKRFLLFPPGAAIVTTISFTKTLVPRSPSGINMIGECDVFYPLQTKIGDWYPPKKAPPPPPPQNEVDDEEDDDVKQGVLPSNLGPIPPNEPQPMNPAPPQPLPILPQDQGNAIPPPQSRPAPSPFLPTPSNLPDDMNRLPSDQEIGIMPGPLVSDPNFNVGKHPGEIYIDNNDKKSSKIPPRRYFSEYYKSPARPHNKEYQQYPYYSSWNSTGGNKTYNDLKTYNYRRFNSYKDKTAWNPIDKNVHTLQNENNIYSDLKDNSYRRFDYKNSRNQYDDYKENVPHGSASDYQAYYGNSHSRGSRERRDIYDQLESFMSFKQFDTKSCILRMICETRHYLLPPGKSLFQDIFRILFTLPAENDPEDEYNRAAKATEDECDSVYSKECRFSVLGFLMSKDRPIL